MESDPNVIFNVSALVVLKACLYCSCVTNTNIWLFDSIHYCWSCFDDDSIIANFSLVSFSESTVLI